MPIRKVSVGTERLELATRLLQRVRLADATAGVWEAADVQWWSRTPRRSDDFAMPFWLDDHGPVAAVLLTDWNTAWGLDVLRVRDKGPDIDDIWGEARSLMAAASHEECETLVREDDDELVSRLVAAGFEPGSRAWEAWMNAGAQPRVVEPPDGYRLVDRAENRPRPHPMVARSGQDVEERLRRCSLYDPALDLTIQAADGSFAGYALFWADPVTSVGLLEPMRVEDAHARRGLARAMLTNGLDRLVKRGMARLKVGFETEAARALYVGAGFRPGALLRKYSKPGHLTVTQEHDPHPSCSASATMMPSGPRT
jgi:ribosomal protein S18 acetylase RimI-like enzyme